jgi:ribose transport system substrate-binding protein
MGFPRRLPVMAGAVALMIVLVAFAGQAAGGARATVQIALFGYNTTPYALYGKKAAEAAAKKYGAKITFFDGKSDPHQQLVQMQDAISTGKYQAFLIQALDGHALQPLAQQAQQKGIKTASVDATLGGTNDQVTIKSVKGVNTTIGIGLLSEAQNSVAEIKKACAAKVGKGKACNVAIQPGALNFPPDVYRIGVMKGALKKTGYIKTSQMPEGQYYQQGAQKSTLDFFQTKPKVDVLYSFADQMIAGDLIALKQLSLTPGKDVYLIGFGATKEAVAGIKSGKWYASLALYPASDAKYAVQYLVRLSKGKSAPKVINALKQPGHLPLIDAALLKKHPKFKPDWSYGG